MEFKNPQEELGRFRSRIAVAGGFVLVCFMLLFARFLWLQIVQHDYYQTRAEDNRISLVPIVPNRGLIVDRNGAVLARNYSAYTLEITPARAGDLEKTIDGLATIIEIEAKDRRRFKKLMDESKSFETLPIRTRLSDEEVAPLHRPPLPLSQASRSRRACSASTPAAPSPRTSSATSAASPTATWKRSRRARRTPTIAAPTTSAKPGWSSATNSTCTASAATSRSRSMPAAAPCAP
jgi:hypothetical protein